MCVIAKTNTLPVAELSEIEELRAQLKSLEERVSERSPKPARAKLESQRATPQDPERQHVGPQQVAKDSPFEGASAVLEQAKEIASEWHLPEASEKLGEFLSALGEDIKEAPPRALIAAFLAGFVAGKVVGR